ncbi:MAG: CoA-acylating methylmalonate-semialdehyde dehydrogenase [Myxococcales bacterium]|nr:MAG: CoA-acylating methylmalonate-semialdehyde dehydrogenase [Myxococcales bacterium]
MSLPVLKNYIDGAWVESKAREFGDVHNPVTGETLARVPLSPPDEAEAAAQAAREAFKTWRRTPPLKRARILLKLKELILAHQEEIAVTLTREHGKIKNEAHMELQRAIENIEVASGAPSMMMGHNLEDVSEGIDEYAIRQPVGVYASLNPFNFPAMIPFWSLPYAVACGDCQIVKASPLVPMTMTKIFELIHQAGFPKGVLNLVHGGAATAQALMASPAIQGISFVGSTPVGRIVYETSAKHGKRVQVQAGAKNWGVVMPDASLEKSAENIIASAYDCTGQRCLALAGILCVGDTYERIKPLLKEGIARRKIGDGLEPGVAMGPITSPEARARVEKYVAIGLKEGAKLLVDGRGVKAPEHRDGYWVGHYVFEDVTPEMTIAKEEIFGPVLCMIRVKSFDEALEIIHASPFGNAANIYTSSGATARRFKYEARCGNLGINIGVPAPMAMFHFAGTKQSFFGDLHAQGRDAFKFFTEETIVIERWFDR